MNTDQQEFEFVGFVTAMFLPASIGCSLWLIDCSKDGGAEKIS